MKRQQSLARARAELEVLVYNHLRYIPEEGRDRIIKSVCVAMLELSHPIGGCHLNTDNLKTAVETRAMQAARVLARMARYQERTSVKFLSAWAFPITKEYLWKAVFSGWCNTEDASIEKHLAGVLSRAYIVDDGKEEIEVIEKTTRDALEQCKNEGRVRRLLALCTKKSGYCVARLVAHRLVNLTHPRNVAKVFA